MAQYNSWNHALAAYVTAGVAKGSPIFLSIDEVAIEEIAERFLDEPAIGDPLSDFIQAVRRRCVDPIHQSVCLQELRKKIEGVPDGVGFLALMVLAAYNMQEEEGIDESNYFLRLREVLGLPAFRGRPEGMPAGAEEPLWNAWNQCLMDAGFQTTAERGAGPQTYLRYVLSQAILRESDKQYLCQRFYESHLQLQFDCDQLGFWLSRQQINRKHLREGLHHADPGRVWEFYLSAHRVYEAGDWVSGLDSGSTRERALQRSIECGLYRIENLMGDSQYCLFARQPARMKSSRLTVSPPSSAGQQELRPLRAGFFTPLWPQAPFVDEALELNVGGDPGIEKMRFPKRDFWILIRDPETPLGPWATWRPYLELGEQLLVLCRPGPFDAEMARFKAAKLLEWTNRVEDEGWVEYHGCMVLSYDWGGFIPTAQCRSLADALAPRAMAGVSLAGGLRDPNQNAWLEGYLPTMKVYGFERQFEIVVTSAHGLEVYCEEVQRQSEVTLPNDLKPDTYQIEIKGNGKRVAMRMFRIVSWAEIQEHPEPEGICNSSPASTAGLRLRGALIISETAAVGEGEYA